MKRRSPAILTELGRTARVLLAPAHKGSPAYDRLQVRLMGNLLTVLLPLFALLCIASVLTRHQELTLYDHFIGFFLLGGTVAAYRFNVGGRQRVGARLLATVNVFGALLAASGEHDPIRGVASVAFATLAVLYASVLLSPRDTVVFAVASLACQLALPVLNPAVHLANMSLPVFYVAFLSTLLVITAYMRQRHVVQLERQTHQLTEGQSRLRVTMDSSLDAVVTVDERGLIAEWSRHAAATFGWSREEAVNRDFVSLTFPGEAQDEVRALVREVATTGGAKRAELKARRRDGNVVPVELSASGIHLRGRPAAAVFMRDVSDRRQMEAELVQTDRLVSVGRLAAGVAHEINNPMTYVLSNVEMALHLLSRHRAALGDDARELDGVLGDALEGATRVQTIVRDLRTFSRATTEDRSPVQVARVLDSAAHLAMNEIRQRATLLKDYQPVPAVRANEARLGQVFLNLLLNAVQALPPGRGRHEIRLGLSQDPDGRVVATVADTGKGIPAEVQARMFAPFFTTKPVGQGTGLGLYISRNIVAAHGGEIRFHSAEGIGTTFSVVLPPAPAEEHEATPLPSARASSALVAATDPPLSILAVDDDPALLRALGRMCSQHRFTAVGSGAEALLACERRRFELILCDVMMPGMTGLELADALVQRGLADEESIVFITGGAFGAEEQDFLARNPHRWLEKPLSLSRLNAVAKEAADRVARKKRSA